MARKKRTKRQTTEFRLEDVDGEEHVYDVALHPGSEGQAVATKLAALLSQPLAEAIQAFADREDLSADDEAVELLEELDTAEVASHLKATLLELDSWSFFQEIFAYTDRDGEKLSTQTTFDEAYRGNYGELVEAAWKVIEANRFLHSLGTLMN